jgi:Tfp pilus assembly protein PilX
MPVMAWMLVVISLLVTAFFTVAVQLSDTTNRDRSQKRALAAAEAGLQTAVYRLNQIRNPAVPSTMCMTDRSVSLVSGQCPAAPTEQLGNGASFTYYVTPELGTLIASQRTCVSLPGQTSIDTDRCITAIGTANGVSRRLQVRVTNQPGPPTFNQVGVLGKSLVFAGNSSKITSDVGTNGQARFGNSAETISNPSVGIAGAVQLGPGGTYSPVGGTSGQKVVGGVQNVDAFELPPIDFEAVESTATNVVTPGWSVSGAVYSAANRTFTINSGTVTMPPGTYHFCRVHLGVSVKWRFHSTLPTRIYVDSPDRSGSVCGAGTGTFTSDESVEINKEAGAEQLLDIFVSGTAQNDTRTNYSWCSPAGVPAQPEECKSDFMLDNSVWIEASVYAPNTSVQANNSVTWIGAVGADKIRFNNSITFTLTDAVKNRPSGSQGAALRTAWGECRAAPTVATDPESGC